MGGAKRALVTVFKDGRLIIESISNNIERDFPEAANIILRDLKPEDNDAIIIAGADKLLKAKRGAFAASWVLISNDEKT